MHDSSLVGVCRHLAAVMWSTYTTVMYTMVVSVVDLWSIHDGRVRNINLFFKVGLPETWARDTGIWPMLKMSANTPIGRYADALLNYTATSDFLSFSYYS